MGDERENQSILITSVDLQFSIDISTDMCIAENPVPVKLKVRRRLFHTLLQSLRTHMVLQRHQVIPNPHLYHQLPRSALCRPSDCLALLP
jgi:hypothetical protein